MATAQEVMKKYTQQPAGAVTWNDIQSLALFIRSTFADQKFYLVGGAALQLMGSARATKQDLDAIFFTQEGMNTVKSALSQKDLDPRLLYSGSGAYVAYHDSIYWYTTSGPFKAMAVDMHYAGQKVELPVLAPELLHTFTGSVLTAPPVYLLCTKLIAWESEFNSSNFAKASTHSEDIKFLLRLIKSGKVPIETMKQWPPQWTDQKSGMGMWNKAKESYVGYFKRVSADERDELLATADKIFNGP